MEKYIRLLRVKHYIKNLLIFIPMFFGGAIFDGEKLERAVLGFICFCFVSSSVYIFNDYWDIKKDRLHPTKKYRPLASGTITPQKGKWIMAICIGLTSVVSVVLGSFEGAIYLLTYFFFNIAYSMGLKNKPIIDVIILAAGYVIRILYGGIVTDITISKWMYLVITTGSFYMVLCKRRNELYVSTETRDVLHYYNEAFLDRNMYVCVVLADVFYALWALEMPNPIIIWTVPVFVVILMCYSLDTEGISDGDPVEVILRDKILIALILCYATCIFILLYMM